MSKYDDEFYNIGLDKLNFKIDPSDKSKLAEEALNVEDPDVVLEAVRTIDEEKFLKTIVEKLLKKYLPKKYHIINEALRKIHDQDFLKSIVKFFGTNSPELKAIIPQLTDLKLIKYVAMSTSNEEAYAACIEKLKTDTEFLYTILDRSISIPASNRFKAIFKVVDKDFVQNFLLKEIPKLKAKTKDFDAANLAPFTYAINFLPKENTSKDFFKELALVIPDNDTGEIISEQIVSKIDDVEFLKDVQNKAVSKEVKKDVLLQLAKLTPEDEELQKNVLLNKYIIRDAEKISVLGRIKDLDFLKTFIYTPLTPLLRYHTFYNMNEIYPVEKSSESIAFYKKLLNYFPSLYVDVLPYFTDSKYIVEQLLKDPIALKININELISNGSLSDAVLKRLYIKVSDPYLRKNILDELEDTEWKEKLKRPWGKQLVRKSIKIEEESQPKILLREIQNENTYATFSLHLKNFSIYLCSQ